MKCENIKELNEIKVKYLGKKGELTVVLRGMGALSPEERPVIGSLVNQVRDELSCLVEDKEKQLKKEELLKKQFLIVYQLMILNYCIALATSSAKFSSFFSIPSPVSNLTKLLTVTSAPISLETSFIY